MTQPAVLIRLRPVGPWRFGAGEGGDHRLDTLYRSDRLYSAITLAMEELGLLEEWLDGTARADRPVVAVSSLFPFQGETLFAPPPSTCWPPPATQLTSSSPVFVAKVRWEAVRFVPLSLVETLVTGQQVLADQWVIDAESGCLLRRDRPSQSPFRIAARSRAAVDRLTATSQGADHAACAEFESGSGLWLIVRFADLQGSQTWADRMRAAFRLLADSGFGGRRKVGWGQSAEPEWQTGDWPSLLLPKLGRKADNEEGQSSFYWLLSLYAPAFTDQIDWKSGDYRLISRGGRVQSRSAAGALKKTVRMITEGSVLSATNPPLGRALDVAPEGFPHPVYRSGMALALRLPMVREESSLPVETTPEGVLEVSREAEQAVTPAMPSDLSDEDQPVSQPLEVAPTEHTSEREMSSKVTTGEANTESEPDQSAEIDSLVKQETDEPESTKPSVAAASEPIETLQSGVASPAIEGAESSSSPELASHAPDELSRPAEGEPFDHEV